VARGEARLSLLLAVDDLENAALNDQAAKNRRINPTL
jgi:hypothetical protein